MGKIASKFFITGKEEESDRWRDLQKGASVHFRAYRLCRTVGTAEEISFELNSTPKSISQRLKSLEKIHLVGQIGSSFKYGPQAVPMDNMLEALSENFRINLFTNEKARDFADAFLMVSPF